jgi:NADH dehydrogenase FAD-containing subunit
MQGILERPTKTAFPLETRLFNNSQTFLTTTSLGGDGSYICVFVSGDNPVKYVDPDGETPRIAQFAQQRADAVEQGMNVRSKRTEAIVDAISGSSNALGKIIDKLLGGKYQKAAKAFSNKAFFAFIDAKMDALSKIQPDANGK